MVMETKRDNLGQTWLCHAWFIWALSYWSCNLLLPLVRNIRFSCTTKYKLDLILRIGGGIIIQRFLVDYLARFLVDVSLEDKRDYINLQKWWQWQTQEFGSRTCQWWNIQSLKVKWNKQFVISKVLCYFSPRSCSSSPFCIIFKIRIPWNPKLAIPRCPETNSVTLGLSAWDFKVCTGISNLLWFFSEGGGRRRRREEQSFCSKLWFGTLKFAQNWWGWRVYFTTHLWILWLFVAEGIEEKCSSENMICWGG